MAECGVENDITHLRAENTALREEVAQLQADKEFVWSLWKRLQVASPDLTQAIAEVVKREKEKAEIKDRKVLQILQVKDSRIEQLEKLLIERNAEIKTLIEGKVCLEERVTRLQIENQEYTDRLTFQEDQLKSKCDKERTVDQLHKQLIDAFDRDKVELHKQLSEEKVANSILRAENADLNAVKSVQETKVHSLGSELVELQGQYNKILVEYEAAKKQVYNHDVDIKQLELQLDYKDTEMTSLKKELEELWSTHQQCKHHAAEQASIINQLQTLQQDTQKMLLTQSDSHQVEFQSLNTMYQDLNVKMTELKNIDAERKLQLDSLKHEIALKDEKITELSTGVRERTVKLQTQMESNDFGAQVTASILEKDYQVQSLETERDMLKDRLREKNRTLKSLQKENIVDLDLDLTPVKLCPSGRMTNKDAHLQIRLETLEKRYKNTQQLLKLKSKEVDELRSAHTKRLERLKHVQSNYEIVKKQLEAIEHDVYGENKRCSPRTLRQGDSDKVWNELTYYKQENKALMSERLQLQEELDICKVGNVQDKAEIHELKVHLEKLKHDKEVAIDERDKLLEPNDEVNHQLQSTKYELYGKESALETVVKEKNELVKNNEVLETERRKLRQELNETQRELAEKRIELCEFKSQLEKLQRTTRKLKRSKLRPRRQVSWLSTEQSGDDPDWEDVHETFTTETDTVTSIEEEITAPTARQLESIEAHISRQKRAHRPPKPARKTVKRVQVITKPAPTKDMATSPVKYNDKVRRTLNNSLKNQLKNVKNRLINLQEQMKTARRDKIIVERIAEEQKSTIDSLQKDLLSANQRLRTLRANHQRVLLENESLVAEKAVLEKRPILDEKVTSSPRDVSDDRKMLESRLKISSNECSKQLVLIKSLRAELETKETKITELSEKVNRLERDTAQKRLLLDDARLRLKLSQEQLQTNQVVIEELNNQIQTLNVSMEKQKVGVESAKKRVTASLKEKREYETLYHKTTQKLEDTKLELEKTATSLSQVKVKLASKDREINEIEEAAHEQMRHTVRKSDAAIELMQKKLQNYQIRIQTCKRFVVGLTQRILRSTQNARSVVTKMNEIKDNFSTESLRKAAQVAKDILNINEEDIDDLMNSEKDDHRGLSDDREWSDKCRKLVDESGDFSITLADLMMEKVEEQFRLLSEAATAASR